MLVFAEMLFYWETIILVANFAKRVLKHFESGFYQQLISLKKN